tara:strand:- start:6732 stop:8336 length:1605 start_codon:yes stop_codon:yes gene_type:complete
MQTPGRVVQSQTPMFSPLGERMENANTKLIERSEERLKDTGISRQQTRQLGRIILEFERLNGTMKTMRSEIQQDLRERRKYYKEERKILKEDLENTNLFKTAALFDGRKNLALLSGALALKEASDGDVGGALQATSAAVGLLLPEIISTVLGVIGLGTVAGGGRGTPRGNVGGVRGMRGMGGKGGIITAAIIAASLLGSKLFGGGNADTRRQEGAQQTIAGVNTISEPDVNRFKVQLNRFESILDGMMSGPNQIGQSKKGKTNPPSGPLGAEGNKQLDSEIGEATEKDDFSKGFGSGEVQVPNTLNDSSTIIPPSISEQINDGNIMPSMFTPITKEDLARERALTNETIEKKTPILSNTSEGTSSVSEPTTNVVTPKRTSSTEVLDEINKSSDGDTSMNVLDSNAIKGSSGSVSGVDASTTNALANLDLSGGSVDDDKKIMKGEGWLSKLDPRKWFKQNRNESESDKSGMSSDDVNVVNNQPEEGSGGGSNVPASGDGQVQVNVDTRYRVNSGTSIDKFEHNSAINSYSTFRPD